MKEKLTEIIKTTLRHLVTAGVAWMVDNGWLSAADSEDAKRVGAAALSIFATRMLLLLLAKVNWLDAFKKIFNRLTQADNSTGASKLVLLGALSAAVGFGFFLPSCSLPISGNVFYQHESSGAKGGLEVDKGGRWKPWAKVPIKNDEGETVGTVGGAIEVDPTK